MYLNINYIVYTMASAAIIAGIVIGAVRQRCATIKDEVFVTLMVWFGLSLSSAVAEFVFKRFGWYLPYLTFIVGLVSCVFIGYCVGRIGYYLLHAYNKKK